MDSSNRIIINTVAQYTKTFINIILSLYSSRLVLMMLGESDYGVFSLIAGFVALLSFLTNSMVMSTQRFLSISQGKGNIKEVKGIFNNSLILHLAIGLLVVSIFLIMTPFLFNGFLNIPSERVDAARILFYIIIGVLFISFQTTPYRALLVSHENIIYISVIDVIDGMLKLCLVLLLPYSTIDSLITYGYIILCIQLFNYFAFTIYDYLHYSECVVINLRNFDIQYIKKLVGFTGWITLSSFCLVCRNQGFAIVINKMLETTANAAYGIANQLSGYLNFLSSSFATSVAPQLMQAVGKGDYSKAITLAKFQSKMGYLLMGLIVIPLVFEMNSILTIWLKEYPENTALFAIMIVSSSLIDQPTYGITTLFRAIGKLAFFTIAFYGPKFLILPFSFCLLNAGYSLKYVAILYFCIESICMFARLLYIKRIIPSFSISCYLQDVHAKLVLPTICAIFVCALITTNINPGIRIIMTFVCSSVVYIMLAYYFALNSKEKNKVLELLHKFQYISR